MKKNKGKNQKKVNNNLMKDLITSDTPNEANKKRIKELQKRKKEENEHKKKEIKKRQKIEKAAMKKQIKMNMSAEEIRKKKQGARRAKAFGILVLLVVAIVLFLLSPIFDIQTIEVTGNEKISKEKIISMLQIENGTNILKAQSKALKTKLAENPYIDTEKTTISKVLPSTLSVRIVEKTPKFIFENNNEYAYVDKDGNVLEVATKKPEGKIEISGYTTPAANLKAGNKINEDDIRSLEKAEKIITEIEAFEKNYEGRYEAENGQKYNPIYNRITSINISDKSDIQFYVDSEKKTIHFGDETYVSVKMIYIIEMLKREKNYEGEIFVNMPFEKTNKPPYFRQKV